MLDGNQLRIPERPAKSAGKPSDDGVAAAPAPPASDVVAAHLPGLHAWLVSLCRDRQRAADLTQECFAAFWATPGRATITNPRAWLCRTARNLFRADLRRRRREPRSSLDAVSAIATAQSPRDSADVDTVRAAALALPQPLREPIALRYWCELSDGEIASVLGIPVFVVRWRIHSAKQWLRAQLETCNPRGGDNHVPR